MVCSLCTALCSLHERQECATTGMVRAAKRALDQIRAGRLLQKLGKARKGARIAGFACTTTKDLLWEGCLTAGWVPSINNPVDLPCTPVLQFLVHVCPGLAEVVSLILCNLCQRSMLACSPRPVTRLPRNLGVLPCASTLSPLSLSVFALPSGSPQADPCPGPIGLSSSNPHLLPPQHLPYLQDWITRLSCMMIQVLVPSAAAAMQAGMRISGTCQGPLNTAAAVSTLSTLLAPLYLSICTMRRLHSLLLALTLTTEAPSPGRAFSNVQSVLQS